MKHNLYPWSIVLPVVLVTALVLGGADAPTPSADSTDTDSDGMFDTVEQMYGLDYLDARDALLDYDGDRILNTTEVNRLGTDPFFRDSDFDGLEDGVKDGAEGADKISRYYMQFGSPWFCTEREDGMGEYNYPLRPAYIFGVWKEGGAWVSRYKNPEAGRVPRTNSACSSESYWQTAGGSNEASLMIALDRTILTNDLWYVLHYFDSADNSALFVDLLTTNREVIWEDVYGNLMEGSNEEVIAVMDLPTASCTNAAIIRLRQGSGKVTVFDGLICVPGEGETEYGDGNSSSNRPYPNGGQTNGITNAISYFDTTNNVVVIEPKKPTPPDDDKDKDKNKGVIYVDQARGNDSLTGRAGVISGKHGPKKTVRKGMAAVDEDRAHTLVIKSGTYAENLNIGGKNVRVVIEGKVKL